MQKVFNWFTLLFVLLLILGLIFWENKEYISSKIKAANSAAIETTAEEVLQAYKTNKIAINNQFKDKNTLVTGKIESIETDLLNEPVIVFKTTNKYEFLKTRASLIKNEQDKAAKLTKGQRITLLCSEIKNIAGMPTMRDCLIK